jgi:transcriptional regulator with XRE-family HTH domain
VPTMNTAQRLKKLREEKGLSQNEIAKLLGT